MKLMSPYVNEAMIRSNCCGIVVRLQNFKFKFKKTLR